MVHALFEPESVMAVVPRDVPFEVRVPLEIPESAWQADIAVLVAQVSLTRFTVVRSETPGVDGRALPAGLPPASARAPRRAPKERRKAA
ncbi:hypothetical protein [Streptomyces noursei]|uniref:hypothetical protein n=1 Tax=Streptomyces noursei TaxID=1971 RepID=UPI0019638819|nr:hypothetical protein [Streptomyces noursei]QRX92133.1 hypothetical protein JNO44_15855 [Streptomyces noursei]